MTKLSLATKNAQRSVMHDVDIRCMKHYHESMTRTTISLPDELYQRLVITAQMQDKSTAELMRELLQKAIMHQEKKQLDKLYQGLSELKGLGGAGVTDASTTIDETLYGKQGAWKGKTSA